MSTLSWETSRFRIDLSRPQVMGIVNLTPDSFSDGGQNASVRAALARCERLIGHGADLLDLGAESSRPGATPLAESDELARLLPVLKEAVHLGVPISVDTYKPRVMQAVLDLGADIINDIWALRWRDDAGVSGVQVVAQHPACGICLMHMHGEPMTMQTAPMHGDVLAQVLAFLRARVTVLQAAGVAAERIAVDPGIGFGKTRAQNFDLLARQTALRQIGLPLLVGWSRKSSLAHMNPQSAPLAAGERLVPSVTACVLAVQRGAHVVRVHDVLETVQALKVVASAR